jgi:putative glutamine amidotransferase
MTRPIIGLTTYGEQVKFGTNETFAAVLPMSYVRAVHGSGGRAVLITQDDAGTDVLGGLDGIIFTGGPDVSPSLYGAEPHERTVARPARDDAELPLMRAALAADLPTLAICRGMQLMAVAYGGRLFQHLPDVLGHEHHRPSSGPKYGRHDVRLVPGSLAHEILGDVCPVNSRHHQGVADAGRLTVTGRVPGEPVPGGDELIEVVEDPTRRFALGVQWHPEETDDRRLFVALVNACSSRLPAAIGH